MAQQSTDISGLAALHAKAQASLIEFLSVDLNLGFTMLEIAHTERTTDPEHCRSALAKVGRALEVIRHLQERVEDSEVLRHIRERADRLALELGRFEVE